MCFIAVCVCVCVCVHAQCLLTAGSTDSACLPSCNSFARWCSAEEYLVYAAQSLELQQVSLRYLCVGSCEWHDRQPSMRLSVSYLHYYYTYVFSSGTPRDYCCFESPTFSSIFVSSSPHVMFFAQVLLAWMNGALFSLIFITPW